MIEIQDFSFSYHQKNVLTDVSAHFAYKDFCVIIGPNGAGKSTLLKSILKLTGETEKIRLKGKALTQYTFKDLAKEIAFVPQHCDIVFDFSVEEIVMMGRHPHQKRWSIPTTNDRQCVEHALEITKLTELKEKQLTQLSGGELQRALIARAIAQDTPILLLDEPLSNLDIAHQFEVMDILTELNQQQNRTILMVIHDFAIAKQYAKNALLLKDGHVFGYGSCSEMITPEKISKLFDLPPRLHLDQNGNVFKNQG